MLFRLFLLCRLIATLAVLIRPAVLAQTSPATSGHDDAFYISFQVPDYHDTYPQSINRSFSVAGYCAQATSNYHGFVRGSEGRINLIDPPGSTFTIARGINAAGAIVGYFQESNFFVHGFVRSPEGVFATIDYLGNQTLAWSINDAGVVTGYYVAANRQHGFMRSTKGKIISFDPPGSTSTFPTGINNERWIIGS